MSDDLNAIFASYEGKGHELIPILQQAQAALGYLPEETMLEIAQFTGVPESRVYAVATFYKQFRFTPIGRKHVTVCRGTACHVRGGARILEEVEKQLGIREGETTPDLEYSLETVACIGACGLAPNMMINQEAYGRLTAKKISQILDDIRGREERPRDED